MLLKTIVIMKPFAYQCVMFHALLCWHDRRKISHSNGISKACVLYEFAYDTEDGIYPKMKREREHKVEDF